MDRRAFITLVGGTVLAVPPGARAQHTKVPLVGILNSGLGESRSVDAVRQGLRDLGWVEGHTIAFDVRFAGAKPEAFLGLAADLVRREVAIIYVSGPAGIRAAMGATRTIPIVALDLESDPVGAGFARSLAQPGGTITGCFLDQPGLTGKWLELILEAAPEARRIAVLRDPTTGPWQLDAINSAAPTRNLELHVVEIRSVENLGQKLEGALKERPQGLVQLSSPLFDIPRFAKRIADFAVAHHLPSISMFKKFADAGGLLAYGPDQSVFYKRPAFYIDKILKGAQPGDLPLEQPTKFEMVINLKTAKALGLTVPQTLLLRADEVIE
jgi:putative tryptophan/tyrosine transport system substrate-binding protein